MLQTVLEETLSGDRSLFAATLDCFDLGVVLIAGSGRIVHANAAIRILETLGVFGLDTDSLTFVERGAAGAFALTLAQARVGEGEAAFVAHDSSGRHLLLFRLVASFENTIVFATNLRRRTVGERRTFEIALGLSRAESGVAALLLEGLDVKHLAARLYVSPETVRTHIKRILEKTHTHRQAELVLVLTNIAFVAPARRFIHPYG